MSETIHLSFKSWQLWITLFLILIGLSLFVWQIFVFAFKKGSRVTDQAWAEQVPEIKSIAIKKSKSIIGGKFSENFASYMPDFNYRPTECRFLGNPIDMVAFSGIDENNINHVAFIEIKSGNSTLTTRERQIKNAILDKRVVWYEYRIPDGLTK